jgi:hypothetical protein
MDKIIRKSWNNTNDDTRIFIQEKVIHVIYDFRIVLLLIDLKVKNFYYSTIYYPVYDVIEY